jgi:hypothetical protein
MSIVNDAANMILKMVQVIEKEPIMDGNLEGQEDVVRFPPEARDMIESMKPRLEWALQASDDILGE